MPEFDHKRTFHGTSEEYAESIKSGKIQVSAGGGELGQGFYLGHEIHVAKAWAMQKFGCESVVEFRMAESDFWGFQIKALDKVEAIEQRRTIKKLGLQRSYTFQQDVVWAPIVGGAEVYCDQDKWESSRGEDYLNGNTVARRIR